MAKVFGWVKKHLLEVLILLLMLIAYRSWLWPHGYLTSGDWTFHYPEFLKGFISLPQMWESFMGFGGVDISPSFALLRFFYGLLSSFWDYDISERILYFWPALIFSYIGILKLGRLIFKENNVGLFFFAIFFIFNTFILSIQTSFMTYATVYALSPLIFYAFIMMLSAEASLKYVAISIGLLELAWLYEPRGVVALSYFLFAYLLYVLFTRPKLRFSAFRNFLVVYAVLACLNLYTFIPLLFLASADSLPTTLQLFTPFNDLRDTLGFHNYSWSGNLFAPFENTPFHKIAPSFYFYFVTLITFSVALFYKQVKERPFLLFLLATSILGIFLLKQQNEPFGGIYVWAFEFIPSFNLFRESNKFIVFMLPISLLFGLSMMYLHSNLPNNIMKKTLLIFTSVLVLVNLKPLLTGQIGTLFASRHIPNDYLVLKDFILKQSEYSKTYWVPTDSRWGIYANDHPKIRGASIIEIDWEQFVEYKKHDNKWPVREQIMGIFNKPYSADLLANASIKYVIVPLRDKENEDDFFVHYGNSRQFYIDTLDKVDFLERIDIGTKDLVIYENKNYKPLISTQSRLVGLDNFDNLGDEYKFLQNNGFKEAGFYINKESNISGAKLKSLFGDPRIDKSTASLSLLDYLSRQKNKAAKLYKNSNVATLSYRAAKNNLEISAKAQPNPSLNGNQLDFSRAEENKVIDRVDLKQGLRYFLQIDDSAVPVAPNKSSSLGRIDENTQVELRIAGKNLIPNPSFEDGLWEQQVNDCNNYDNNAKLTMALDTEEENSTDGTQSLRLEATRHAACTSIKIRLDNVGRHLLSFDYQSPDSKQAGYNLQFNDDKKTVISAKLPIREAGQWQTLTKNLDIPAGATEASLTVYSYESDRRAYNTVFYDNFSLSQTELVKPIKLSSGKVEFEPIDVTLNTGDNTFELNSPDYDGSNIIENPSFEEGLWSKSVGDCHAYDDKPDVASNLDTGNKTAGNQSLQLEATRHIACTSKDINIAANGDHLLSFDMQGVNTEQAGYNLQFNDDEKTVISEKVDIKKHGEWQEFKKKIKVPAGASSASLTIYAYESDGKTKNIARYDNFKFIKIPDLGNTYYLLTEAEQELQAPRQISHTSINPTKKSIAIEGAAKPFALNFSESFHPGWKLYMRPINDKIACNPIRTSSDAAASKNIECQAPQKFMQGDELGYLRQQPAFDDKHIKLNGYANGWVIDPEYVKANYGPEYYRENPDGSIDMNLVAYFKPQSYFYIGLAISGTTFIACITYLVWSLKFRKRRHYVAKPGRAKMRSRNDK